MRVLDILGYLILYYLTGEYNYSVAIVSGRDSFSSRHVGLF